MSSKLPSEETLQSFCQDLIEVFKRKVQNYVTISSVKISSDSSSGYYDEIFTKKLHTQYRRLLEQLYDSPSIYSEIENELHDLTKSTNFTFETFKGEVNSSAIFECIFIFKEKFANKVRKLTKETRKNHVLKLKERALKIQNCIHQEVEMAANNGNFSLCWPCNYDIELKEILHDLLIEDGFKLKYTYNADNMLLSWDDV